METQLTPVATLPQRPWLLLLRRSWALGLDDALGRGVMATTLTAVMIASATALRTFGLVDIAVVVMVLAIIPAVAFLLLVGRAVQRGRAIGYWHQSRELKFALGRERAYSELVTGALRMVHQLDIDEASNIPQVLELFATDVQTALSQAHDDVAVALAIQSGQHFWILQSALGPASPWTGMLPGKRCAMNGRTFEETAADLASYSSTQCVAVKGGHLLFAVLSNTEFTDRDRALFRDVPMCLSLITARWEYNWQEVAPQDRMPLRSVG